MIVFKWKQEKSSLKHFDTDGVSLSVYLSVLLTVFWAVRFRVRPKRTQQGSQSIFPPIAPAKVCAITVLREIKTYESHFLLLIYKQDILQTSHEVFRVSL